MNGLKIYSHYYRIYFWVLSKLEEWSLHYTWVLYCSYFFTFYSVWDIIVAILKAHLNMLFSCWFYLAMQIRRSLLNEDEYGFRKARRPIYYDEGLEVIRLLWPYTQYSSSLEYDVFYYFYDVVLESRGLGRPWTKR